MSQRIKPQELIALCILLTYISCSYDVYTTCNVHDQSYYVKNIAETHKLFTYLYYFVNYWNVITTGM